ncbi:MAG: hypothetical protein ABSB40_07815 [Nitrososphaeria archaeon]|jgi:archaellum component FlaF (FlaF/FlaG flagellin family)
MSRIVYVIVGILILVIVIAILAGLVIYFNTQPTAISTSSNATTMTSTSTTSNEFSIEKLVISAYASSTTQIVLKVQSTGSSDAEITDILLNGIPLASATPAGTLTGSVSTLPYTLPTGASVQIALNFATPLSSGATYDITIHTDSGNDYPIAVVAP